MPGLFEQFPHTNLHELNLDWLINMINQFKEELEDSAVLSVNGETGHVTLYESENVILPALPEGVDQWRLVRLMDGQYVGILFYNNHAYFQRGNETMRLLTLEDIPSSSGVVSWNGLTGVVNVTGQDIPVDDTADADSIEQAITNEHTERVNADNTLQNNISTLNSKMLPEEVPVSGNATVTVGTFDSSLLGYKTLSIMELNMFVNGVTIANSTTFGQIEVKPKRNLYLHVVDNANGTPINGNMYLNTNGTLTYYGDAITNKKISVSGTYTFNE